MTDAQRLQQNIDTATEDLVARIHEYENVLRFYARHEHWMGITEDSEFRTVFVAAAGDSMDGFSIAEKALQKFHGAMKDDGHG